MQSTIPTTCCVLMQWLEEPQTGPAEFANMMDALGKTQRAKSADELRIQIQDRTRVDASLTSSAVRRGKPVGAQRDDVARGTRKKSQKCVFL